MGLSGIPEGGNSIPQDTVKTAKQKQGSPISENYIEKFKEYFKTSIEQHKASEPVKLQEVEAELAKEKAILEKKIAAQNGESSESVIIEEFKAQVDDRELARMAGIYENQRTLLIDLLKSDSIPEDTKAAYENRLEFLNNKIAEIETLLRELNPEANKDSDLVGLDFQMMNAYNIQKQEIIEELKTVGDDYRRKNALETKLMDLDNKISNLQSKIHEEFEAKMFPESK